jgi:hypothetical protein
VPFELHASDRPAGPDRDEKSRAEVEGCHLPAEQAKEEDERDLVDHGRGDQERERHPQRHPRSDEPDEERHRRARAERRRNAEERREHVAGCFTLSGEELPRALRREVAPQHPNDEDDAGEEQEDFRHLEDEKLDRRSKVAARREAGEIVRREARYALKLRVEGPNRRHRDRQ